MDTDDVLLKDMTENMKQIEIGHVQTADPSRTQQENLIVLLL